jgi:hypothetical protein
MHNDKFNNEIVNLINNNFNLKENCFIFYGGYSKDEFQLPLFSNVIVLKDFNEIKYYNIDKAEKIIFHGLYQQDVINFFYNNQNYLPRCYWVIWGGDIYDHKSTNIMIKTNNKIFSDVYLKIGNLVSSIQGDIDIVKKFYKNTGKEYLYFIFPNNCYKNFPENNIDLFEKKNLSILLNHSASTNSNHMELLDILKKYDDKINKIICPLSYCSEEHYTNKVIEKGFKIFGNKFQPITDFMNKEEYYRMLLEEIDIGIFGHENQQGLGNISTLICMGKKIYINKLSPINEYLSSKNLLFFLIDDLLNENHDIFNFKKLNAIENKRNMKKYCSYDKVIEDWGNLLKD